MELAFSYLGRSRIERSGTALAVSLAPNLRRDRVSFVGLLKQPLRFREAICALHDVVISDLRYQPRDRSAYQAYLQEQKRREAELRRGLRAELREELRRQLNEPIPPGLEKQYAQLRRRYWDARQKYSRYLCQNDPELWRLLMPCDPVVTVAPDVLFFECFSADESSYGCLTVDRAAFAAEQEVAPGTTNVDYSWALYEHFQEMRSYRETRFLIDPSGFEVQTEGTAGQREEKIDLPQSWLRGFLQLQSAMSLPMRRVPLGREGLYNLLAFLKRHRARKSPRAVRFELEPGKPARLVLEPWEQRIEMPAPLYAGARAESIRTWGRDRLRVLGRLLPLVERAEVFLLGTGLPSFWVMDLGELRLILGLSGWTANDWTGAGALDQLSPPAEPNPALLGQIASAFRSSPALTVDELRSRTAVPLANLVAGLNRLALLGQVIHDLPAGKYRWRQVMPVALSLAQIGPDHPETVAARDLVAARTVHVVRDEPTPTGLRLLMGQVPERPAEVLLDADGRIVRGKCTCSWHFQGGLRRGPCRHIQALRNFVLQRTGPATLDRWLEWISQN
jgi:hypothetical protein